MVIRQERSLVACPTVQREPQKQGAALPWDRLSSAKMPANGDELKELRRQFRAALADEGWASPDTLRQANNLAIALWERGHAEEAHARHDTLRVATAGGTRRRRQPG
jgi:hypothetical protein